MLLGLFRLGDRAEIDKADRDSRHTDGQDGDQLTARTEGGRLVRFEGTDALIGTYQTITITGSTTWSLTGTL